MLQNRTLMNAVAVQERTQTALGHLKQALELISGLPTDNRDETLRDLAAVRSWAEVELPVSIGMLESQLGQTQGT